jgi:hypothetical protein
LRIPLALLSVPVLASLLYGETILFGDPTFIEVNGHRLQAGYYSAPLVTDWNCDGKPDLLVGQYEDGRIRFYPNEGEPGAPLFTTYQYLLDDGVPLSVPWG